MSETHRINGVDLRENGVGSAIILSIVTLGIYWLILTYRNSMDIHRAAGKEPTIPVLLFILGIFFAIPMFLLFLFNGLYLDEIRLAKGKERNMVWVVALVLTFVPFIGSIIWAVHYDNALNELSQGA